MFLQQSIYNALPMHIYPLILNLWKKLIFLKIKLNVSAPLNMLLLYLPVRYYTFKHVPTISTSTLLHL